MVVKQIYIVVRYHDAVPQTPTLCNIKHSIIISSRKAKILTV